MPSKPVLGAALKSRVRGDNPDFFTPEVWDGDDWLAVPLGHFYGEDDEIVNAVVFEVTRDVLLTEQRKLPDSAKTQLVDRVGPDAKPPDAVNEMFSAAQLAVPK